MRNKDVQISKEWAKTLEGMTPFLRACARKYLTDSDEVNDLAQDVLLKVLQNERNFDGTNLKAWLNTVLRNTFINEYRRGKKYQLVPFETELVDDGRHYGSVENEAHGRMEINDLAYTLDQLPEMYGDVLKARIAGFKYEEIAQSTGIPVGTVKNRIHLAKEKVDEFLRSKQFNPNRMQTTTPEATESLSPPVADENEKSTKQFRECRAILSYLKQRLPVGEKIKVDRTELCRTMNVTMFYVNTVLPLLVEKGYLTTKPYGASFLYTASDSLGELTDARLDSLVRQKMANASQKQKDKAAEVTKPTHRIQHSTNGQNWIDGELSLTPDVKKLDGPLMESIGKQVKQSFPLLTKFGFWTGEGYDWFDDKESAAKAAMDRLSGQQGGHIEIVARLGEVSLQPTINWDN